MSSDLSAINLVEDLALRLEGAKAAAEPIMAEVQKTVFMLILVLLVRFLNL